MAHQLCRVVLRAAKVSVQDAVVAAARAQESRVPRDGADASIVAPEGLDQPILCGIPDLQLARVRTHCK